ncbi:tail fiber assembly protein [Pseudomonas sp. ZL2]
MLIKLSPVRADAELSVSKQDEALTLNGTVLDFSRLADGASLPAAAISSEWIIGDVERANGSVVVMLRMPHGPDASEAARFPADIVNPQNGVVRLPTGSASAPASTTPGVIDWSQMVTVEMKAQAAAEQHLATVVAETAARRATADAAIDPLQDAVDIEDATEAEVAALKAWKKYRVALIRLPDQAGYPATIDWPVAPA